MRCKDVFYAVLLVLATAACPADSRRGRKQKAARGRAEQDTAVGHAKVASSPMDLVQRLREQIDQCVSGLGASSAAPGVARLATHGSTVIDIQMAHWRWHATRAVYLRA